jgi:hypothetical protein
MSDRPKRKAIPAKVKVEVCLLLLRRHGILPEGPLQWDHFPSLGLRPVNESGDDYDPPQLDPRYIDPMPVASHAFKTNGPKHDHSQGDKGRIAKVKRLEADRLFAQSVVAPTLPVYVALGNAMIRGKAKRKLPSRPFPKGRKFNQRSKA